MYSADESLAYTSDEQLDKFERSFFLLYTAAILNHKHARFMIAY